MWLRLRTFRFKTGGKLGIICAMTLSRFIFYCVLLLAVAYGALTLRPDVLFDHEYTAGNVSMHSHEPLNEGCHYLIGRVQEKIAADDFYDPGQKLDIYLAGDDSRYALLAPFCKKAFSCLHPVTGKIFIAAADLEKNLVYSPGGAEDPRGLESVITHELVKAQIKNKLGALAYLLLDRMKKDGYAEHITRETAETLPAEICSKNERRATLTRYLTDRLTLELVQFETDLTYSALLRNDKGDASTADRLKQKYCN